jgi:hypothetical protein
MRRRLSVILKVTGLIIGVVAAVAVGLSAYLMSECGLAGCGDGVDTIEQAVTGPDGRLTAWLVSSDGSGATGEHNLLVYVGPTGSDPIRTRRTHPTVPTSSPAPRQVLWLEHALDLTLRWAGRNQLVVEYPAKADVERKRLRVGDVTVTYIPIDSLETSWLHERAAVARDGAHKGG